MNSRAFTLLAALCAVGCGESSDALEPSPETGGKADDVDDGDEYAALEGVADLHLHMFAEEAFGGGWLHGTHDGSGEHALGPCDGGEPGDHARLQADLKPLLLGSSCDPATIGELAMSVPLVGGLFQGGGAFLGEEIGKVPGSDGDTGLHTDRTGGFPDFRGFPRWDTIAHQQAWEGHLEQAWKAGLRLEVISAVSFNWLCEALPDENVERPQCDEMDDVFVQLEQAHAFAERTEWAEIALSAGDARRIIGEGKLALVLSVEASHLLGTDGDWREGFEKLYDMGVRTLQPVHQLDNRFAGAAPHNPIHHIFQYAETCHVDTDCPIGLSDGKPGGVTLGFDLNAECKNVVGLRDEGRELLATMMERGMLIDAAHLSERSVKDLYEMAKENDFYPFYLSHGHFREMLLPSKQVEEKTTPWWVAKMLRETGGIFGMRTAPDEVSSYDDADVSNDCHGSSKSFAQYLAYATDGLGVDVAFGADFNGFIQQTRPRFGPDACSASFPEEQQCQAEAEELTSAPPLGTDFDDLGLAHTGLLIDLVDDLDQLGADTRGLRSSADAFVQMWERAEGERSGPAESADDLSEAPGGVRMLPPHDERLANGCQ